MEAMVRGPGLTLALAAVIGLPLLAASDGLPAANRGLLQARHDDLAQRLATGTSDNPPLAEQ